MGKVFITDEINDSYVADIYSDGRLKTGGEWQTCFVNSGTGSGCLITGACLVHTVSVMSSAAKGLLYLGSLVEATYGLADTCASALGALTSANRKSVTDLAARGCYILDTIFSDNVSYRLTGLDCDGITLTYVKL